MTIPLTPGEHKLQIRVDWCGSPVVDFTVADGETVQFECGCNDWWRLFFLSFFAPLTFLVLRRID